MTAYEIIEVMKESNNGDLEETIGSINDLIEDIRGNVDKFTKDLKEELESFAQGNDCCPICGKELKTVVEYEPSEYQGSLCKEPIYTKYCPEDGYIDF